MKGGGEPAVRSRPGRSDALAALALVVVSFLVYSANGRLIATGDTFPARYLPLAMLRLGTVTLNAFEAEVVDGRPHPYWLATARTGERVSSYPIVTPVLVTPLYVPAVAYLHVKGWSDVRVARVAERMEKIVASLVASLGVGLMYLVLRRGSGGKVSAVLALCYAFGTNVWSSSSQALWQHGVACALLLLALWQVLDPARPRLVVAGLAAGLLAVNRPPDAFLAAGLGLFVLLARRARLAGFALAACASAGLFALYNLRYFGSLLGGYADLVGVGKPWFLFSRSLGEGLACLLVSPGKGLLFYTPFLLLLLAYLRGRTRPPEPLLAGLLAAGGALQLLVYARLDSVGGFCYGPRLLVDLLPVLVWLLAPLVPALRGLGRAVFGLLVAASVYVQLVGAFCYPEGRSDLDLDVWSLERSPIRVESRAGLHEPGFTDGWKAWRHPGAGRP